jgi:hypothetical protein
VLRACGAPTGQRHLLSTIWWTAGSVADLAFSAAAGDPDATRSS